MVHCSYAEEYKDLLCKRETCQNEYVKYILMYHLLTSTSPFSRSFAISSDWLQDLWFHSDLIFWKVQEISILWIYYTVYQLFLLSTSHIPESCGKREPQFMNCLCQINLCVYLHRIIVISEHCERSKPSHSGTISI